MAAQLFTSWRSARSTGRNVQTALTSWRFVPTDATPADQIEPFVYTFVLSRP